MGGGGDRGGRATSREVESGMKAILRKFINFPGHTAPQAKVLCDFLFSYLIIFFSRTGPGYLELWVRHLGDKVAHM